MASPDQEKKSLDGLKEQLDFLVKLKAEDFIRDQDLGTRLNFRDGVPYFERMLKLYHDLAKVNLDGIAHALIENHRQLAIQARGYFEQILSFDPNQSNPKSARDGLIDQIRDNYDGHFQRIYTTIAYSIRKGTDFEALEKEARQTVMAVRQSSEDLKKQGDQLKKDAEAVLKSMQDAAAEVGVGHHAINFKTQADEHFQTSQKWLYATCGLGVLGVIALWLLFIGPLKPDVANMNPGQAIYEVVSRLMVFSVISFGIYWAAKNFDSHRHNYVVNKHRQNALTTFQTFVRAADKDQATKNAVLMQAAQAIYMPQPSGYSENGSGSPPPTNVFEVIKKFSPASE